MTQRTAARFGWVVFAVALIEAAAAMLIGLIGDTRSDPIENAIFMGIFALMGLVGALAVARQPRNAVGWILLATTLASATAFLADQYGRYSNIVSPLPGVSWVWWVADWVWIWVLSLPVTFLLLLFPDGRLPSRRWRPFFWFAIVSVSFTALIFALDPRVYPGGHPNPIGIEAVDPIATFMDGPGYALLLLMGLVSAISLFVRFRRTRGKERQQIKWFLFSVSILLLAFLLDWVLELTTAGPDSILSLVLIGVAWGSLPVGLGIAILRHGLFDVDVVINRTVLFGILATAITAIYVGIVVGIGSLVGEQGNLFLSILATALIALAFQPIRVRARHFANRLVYGKRATPYEVLSTFSDQLGEGYSTEDILPRIARMIGEATGAESATVWVRIGNELRPSAGWPDGRPARPPVVSEGPELPALPDDERAYPVRHQGEVLGALSVVTSRREPLNDTQERLLEDLAAQAGLVLRNVRLIEELRASRQRLVAAQDEERRRLERNIHDGAQQQLVALAVKIRLAKTMAGRDLEKAQGLLDELQGETQDALENLRDLARGIYPPLLADKGLAAALEAQARKVPFPVEVHPNGVARYSAEAEATAYFCVLEALQNVAKYAGDSTAVVRLSEDDGHLMFAVSDDGRGFDPATTPRGSGLQNMADRLEAVASSPDAGTTITGRIPVGTRVASL
jgi:signal transduction histidine kinase